MTDSDESRQEALREQILQAGVAAIGELGVEGTTEEAICARAGVSAHTFHSFFQDRDDLLATVMERVGRAFLDAVIASADRSGGLALTVRRFVNAVVSGAYPLLSGGAVRPHEIVAACLRSPDFRRRYLVLIAEAFERLRETVLAGQQQDRVRQDVPAEDVASILVAVVMGMETLVELGLPLEETRVATTLLRLIEGRPRS